MRPRASPANPHRRDLSADLRDGNSPTYRCDSQLGCGLSHRAVSQATGCNTTIVPRLDYLSGSRFRVSDGSIWVGAG